MDKISHQSISSMTSRWNLTRAVKNTRSVLSGRDVFEEIKRTDSIHYLHKRWRITEVMTLEDDDADELRIVVRGTVWYNIFDWLYNFMPFHYRGRHRGWVKQAGSVYRDLRHIIKDSPKTTIHFIGMSQGAAVAQILADKMSQWLPAGFTIKTTAFGSPHPFTRKYQPCHRFLENADSVYAHRDIVVRVPFKWIGFEDKIGRRMIGKKRIWFPFVGVWAHLDVVMADSARREDLR